MTAPAPPVAEERGELVAEMRAYHADMVEDDGGECRATAMYREAADEIERLRAALSSIARNTCCDKCHEAALVAQAALRPTDGAPADTEKVRHPNPSPSVEEVRREVIEEAARVAEKLAQPQNAQLMGGDMTAQEIRTMRAMLLACAVSIRALPALHRGQDKQARG